MAAESSEPGASTFRSDAVALASDAEAPRTEGRARERDAAAESADAAPDVRDEHAGGLAADATVAKADALELRVVTVTPHVKRIGRPHGVRVHTQRTRDRREHR